MNEWHESKVMDNRPGFWYDIVEDKMENNHGDTEARRVMKTYQEILLFLCASVAKY